MTLRTKVWLVAGGLVSVAITGGLYLAASTLAKRVEPRIREEAIRYLEQRFDSDVELGRLAVHTPSLQPLRLLFSRGRGTLAQVDGTNVSLRRRNAGAAPPMLTIREFRFEVNIGALLDTFT